MQSEESASFDSLWDYSDPAQTETKFREILPQTEASGNRSHYLQLLTQIARTYSLRRMFDEAHKLLDEVEPQLSGDMPRARIRYLLERGRSFNSANIIDKARDMFLRAFELASASGEDNLAVDAAHMMGIVEKGNDSVEWNEKALKMAEESGDEEANKWLGALYNNLGWTYFDMKEYGRALELFRKDQEWYGRRGKESARRIAIWSAAKTMRMMGDVSGALQEQRALHELMKAGVMEEDGYVYEELAECMLVAGGKEEAAEYAGLAYDILSGDIWLRENEKQRLDRLKEIGRR